MEEQIPPSQTPEISSIEEMKARAREMAIQQVFAQQNAQQQQQPKIVYLRRNLTVAELLLVFLISCGIVTGIQWSWSALSNVLPKIEIKVR
jgi:hypothetical protein